MSKSKLLSVLLLIFIGASHEAAWSTTTYSQSTTTSETSGQYLDDSAITAKVKSAFLANKYIKSLSISVTTNEGIVTLSGNVDNNMQKKKAIKIASQVQGVKSVNDELSINMN